MFDALVKVEFDPSVGTEYPTDRRWHCLAPVPQRDRRKSLGRVTPSRLRLAFSRVLHKWQRTTRTRCTEIQRRRIHKTIYPLTSGVRAG